MSLDYDYDLDTVPYTVEPPVLDDGAPFPDPAETCHLGDPSTDPNATAGTFRPAHAQVGASGTESEGWADAPTHPSDVPLLSPTLTVTQLEARGVPARATAPGRVAITLGDGLVALRLPAGRPDWRVDAVEATQMSSLLNRIEWVERIDGSLYLLMRMRRPELLAAHATIRDGQTVAELLTSGEVPLSDVARGTRGAVTEVTEAEALGVGALLDWASETATAPMPQAADTRALARDTALVRDAYNRAHPEVEIHDGIVYRAFDLLGEDADDAASRLSESGEVSLAPAYLRAAEIVEVVTNTSVDEVVARIVDVLTNAVQAADATLPLVLSEPGAQGAPARLVSVTPSGEVVRWDTMPDLQTLVLLAVQPVTRNRDGDTRPIPGVPGALLGPIALRLRAAAAPVEHIVFEPALLGDQVVATPGYHRGSHAVLVMPHRERRRWAAGYNVPARPTADEAQAAYELLDTELCGDFPWAAPRDRARMMSALLTGAARTAVTVSPGFSWDANEKGTGKSEAAKVVRLLAQGSVASASWTLGRGADEESMKKLAGALISRSTRFWHNDEVRGPIDSPLVGKIITAGDGAETIRELGGNRLVTVRGVIVTACGNNIRIADDHARRWIRMRMEKPLLQMATGGTYRHPDLEAFTRENRPALVAAAHTLVLRAIQQGPAFPIPALGFGSSWSQRILGALSWVKTSEDLTVASLVLKGWETDVSGADHHVDEWGAALEYAWSRLTKPVPAGDFAKITLTSDAELPLPDELVSTTLRSRAKRWSHALKGLRGQKIVVGDRVYRVVAHDIGGRWTFEVQAFDLLTLQEGREERLSPPPLTDLERTKLKARLESEVY